MAELSTTKKLSGKKTKGRVGGILDYSKYFGLVDNELDMSKGCALDPFEMYFYLAIIT